MSKIYREIGKLIKNSSERSEYISFRAQYLKLPIVKQAFDTRRIDQNLEYNPRRNLQYYQRSESFINDETADKVNLFFKIKTATDELREQFIGEPEWLDSYTRILCNAVNQTLRVDQKDFDYSTAQLDYLSELLYVRYRLGTDDIVGASVPQLKEAFLKKDERLTRRSVFINYKDGMNKISNKTEINERDNLIDKLFGNIKASAGPGAWVINLTDGCFLRSKWRKSRGGRS